MLEILEDPRILNQQVYHVEGMDRNLLSISQLCYKGNKVIFPSTNVEVFNLKTKEVRLTRKENKCFLKNI